MKAKKVKNLQDRFSYEDLAIAAQVRGTYNCGYSRIVLLSNWGDETYGTCGDVMGDDCESYAFLDFTQLKFFYAILVFQRAVKISTRQKQFNPYWHMKWGGEKPFYQLVQYGARTKDAVKNSVAAFWNLLQNVANSGDIKVCEHFWVETTPTEDIEFFPHSHNAKFHVVLKDIDPHRLYENFKDIFTHPYDRTPVSYTWDDIKSYFVELTLEQLSLTMPHLVHAHSKMDEVLMEACYNRDEEGIRYALSHGANVNALNENGESALQRLIEGHGEDEEQTIRLIDLLLNAGADIDLFGIGGMQPLTAAYYEHSVAIVRHLLEKGSNPNYNSFLIDGYPSEYDKNVSCSILSSIDTDESFECLSDRLTPEVLAIKELVIQYGGKLFRDDAVWTEDENKED